MRKDWIEVELEKISQNIQYGYTASSTNENIGPKFLRITDIQDRKVNWDDVPFCEMDSDKFPKYKLEKGDLLFARTGATVGKSFLIKNQVPDSVFASYLIRVRCNKLVLNEDYLSYFFESPKYWIQITENQSGIGQPNVNGTKLGKLIIPIPPLPEQRAIVARIEELFSELDHSIANLKAAQAKLEVYRQAVLKKAFEGGYTNSDSIKWVELGSVCNNVEYGSSSKSEDSGLVPVLRMGNIQNGKFDWNDLKYSNSQDEINKYRLKKDDVLFNRTNSPEHVGKTAIFKGEREAIFAGYLIRINYKASVILGDYLCYFLNSHTAKKFGDSVKSFGVNQSNINGTKLKKYPFPLTSIDEQIQIVQEIESRLSVADKLIETIQTNLGKAEALRQSILKKAFEGKLLSKAEIEACRQETDWKPAERLVERIKNRK